MFYIAGSIFSMAHFKHFDFNEWFDLNSNSNNLFDRSVNSDFLDDFWMYFCTLPNSSYSSKFGLSGILLIN